jgi:hypothetical protein
MPIPKADIVYSRPADLKESTHCIFANANHRLNKPELSCAIPMTPLREVGEEVVVTGVIGPVRRHA